MSYRQFLYVIIGGILILGVSLNAHADKLVRVGFFDKKPIIFTDEKGTVQGLAVDFLADVARNERWTIKFIRGRLHQNLDRIKTNEIDLMVPVGFTPERATYMDFADTPFFDTWGCLYTLRNGPALSLENIDGKRIGCVKSSLFNPVFSQMIKDLGIHCKFVEVPDYSQLISGLIEKKYEGAVGERLATLYVDENQSRQINSTLVFNPFSIFVSAGKGDPRELLPPISRYLSTGKSNPSSQFSRHKDKWLINFRDKTSSILKMLSYCIFSILVILTACVMIRIPVLRKALGLTHKIQHTVAANILAMTIGMVFIFWGVDSGVQYYWADHATKISGALFPVHDPQNMFMRFFIIAVILAAGVLISRVFSRLADQHDIVRKQQERLDLALYAINDGVWDWNLETEQVIFDDRYYTMVGYEPGDFPPCLGSWEKRVHPEDIEGAKLAIDDYLSGRKPIFEPEFRFKRKDESYIWIRAKGKIMGWDHHGNPTRFVGTHSDIHGRKQAELSRDEAYGIIGTSPLVAFIWKKAQGWPVEFVSENIETVFGYSPDEFRSGRIRYDEIVYPDDLNRVMKEVEEYSGIEGCHEFVHKPYRILTKQGQIRWVDDRTRIKRSQTGDISHYQGVILDITERKNMEEIMVQSEKMLSVGGLAAGMAHEINNPLAGMIQSANVMKSRLENTDLPANLNVADELGISMKDIKLFMEKRGVFRMIDAIQESGLRAAEIVRSMLSFARKSEASFSSHYLDRLMDKILDLAATDFDLKKEYDFKSIEIIKEYTNNTPLIPCESAKIQQVLLNILRNGAQAMQEANIQSPRFTIRIYAEKVSQVVCIEIEDNGPGMDEETRLKVFDPFFTTKPVGIGTGLGLSVSYFIITENHKGTIDVVSEPGKGAKFIIRLPMFRESQS